MLAIALRCAAAAAVLAGALPVPAGAQGEAIPRPQLKLGDSWTYRQLGRMTNREPRYRMQVTFASESVIHTVSGKEGDATWTAEWNAVSTPGGGLFDPHSGLLKFPLRAGDSYKVAYEVKAPVRGSLHARHERLAKVIGWETVEVPAGKFRALKIEIEGAFHRLDTGFSGTAKNVIWYVPEVKRWVKRIYEDSTPRGAYYWEGEELLEYRLK